jgi:hypothetical protein
MSTTVVADAADGVMRLGLTYGRYHDILDRGAPVGFEAGRRHVSSIGNGGTLRACRKSICLDPPKRPMIFVNVARVRPTKMGKHGN